MVLFIDTHLNDVVIILYENNEIVQKKVIKNEKYHSKVIMPTIVEVLNDRIPDFLVVVNGPGAFTGVRLGVTIAKALAYTWDKPIRTITYLECMALSTIHSSITVAFSDNNGYYVGQFDEKNNRLSDYIYYTNKEFNLFKENNEVITDIEVDYNKVIEFAMQKKPTNPHEVNPIYIKKLDVEK